MGKSIRNLSTVTRVGLDLAKRVFQVHAVDAKGEIVVARKLTRSQLIPFFAELPSCVVAMEACSSAHHWGRALIELGHEVRLIPPAHVKPYVRRNKSDQVDAAAIYEAMSRPGQRFVPVRSIDNQAELMRHRARELLAGQRTAALNALRGHLAEIGLIAPQGAHHAYGLKRMVADGFNENGEIVVPDCVRGALRSLVGQIDALDEAIGAIDKEIAASVKADETAKRLMTIPGVGPVTASAITATIQDASAFASGREFAAFLGPEAATLTVRAPGKLVLPVRAPDAGDNAVRFEAPLRGRPAPITKMAEGRMSRSLALDLTTGVSTYVANSEGGLLGEGAQRFDEIDSTISHDLKRKFTIGVDDPLTARHDLTQSYELGREGWRIRIETQTSMQASVTHFMLRGSVRAYENGALAGSRQWDETIPRDFL